MDKVEYSKLKKKLLTTVLNMLIRKMCLPQYVLTSEGSDAPRLNAVEGWGKRVSQH
jgi:hypothetical protein